MRTKLANAQRHLPCWSGKYSMLFIIYFLIYFSIIFYLSIDSPIYFSVLHQISGV